jgi:hypothetical protein
MELREFVKDTLLAVVQGVRDAQDELKGHVNPEPASSANKYASDYKTVAGLLAYPVKFDVAVTVTSEANAEGGGKVSIFSFGSAEGRASAKDGASTVSRLQFQVPVAFPFGDG